MAANTDEREEIKPVAPTEQTKWRDPSLVGKYMVDPKTGLAGLFRSPDNGETWVLTDTVYGHVYNQDEVDNIWDNGAAHKVADEIKSATADLPNVRKQADEAVKFAESAIAASKVNSDAIVAQSSAVVEAKSAMDSATAEVQQLAANAASDVAQIESTIAEVQAGVNQAKSANESAVQAVQAELKSTSDAMDKVKKQLNEVGTSLDTYAKSAAEQGHDITVIKQKQGQFETDFASAQGNVNQIQADIKGLRQNIKDNQGNIASLLTSADKLQASMTDAEKNISNLLLTASKYEQTFKDQDGRLSKVEQTATEHTSELTDAKGNLDKVTQKANTLQLLLSDAQKNINNIKIDAQGLHQILTGQNNQLASLNVTLNNLDSKYSGITGDLQSKQTALSTEQQQTKDRLLRKADKSEVDNVKGTVNQVSAEQKTMADQINQKVSSTEYQTLKDKVNGMHVGGRNLLKGTRDFNSKYWYQSGDHTALADNPADPSTKEIHSWLDWHSFRNNQTIQLDPSKDYMISADIAIYGGDGNGLYVTPYGTIDGHDANLISADINLAGFPRQANGEGFRRIYLQMTQKGHALTNFRIEGHGNWNAGSGSVFISKIALYEGNTQQGWEDSSADLIENIQKNATAIDENSKLISLMAKQTEVDNVKNTAQQISSRLDILAGEVKSKVDETRVNNIVDGKGYATTSTVQSLIDQKAGTINESITNLTNKLVNNNGGGVNLVSGTIEDIVVDDTANTGTQGWCFNTIPINADLKVGDKITVSVENVTTTGKGDLSKWGATLYSKDISEARANNYEVNAGKNAQVTIIVTSMNDPNKQTALLIYSGRVGDTEGKKAVFHHLKVERGEIATPYSQAPSDNATVTQLQSVTASIDGLQSSVTNYQNDTSSKYTQLSNLMQFKVGTADFEQLRRSVDMQTLDSADINNMRTNGHYFVRNLANNPIGGWVYVDVTGNGNDRIRQDVYQDSGHKHKYRRWFGTYWTGWEEGATYTEITQLQDALNLRVQKGELLSQINLTAGNTLIQSNKLYLDASSVVITGTAFIPSAAIAELDADKLTFYGNGSKASIGAGVAQYDQDKIKSTINLQYQGGFEIHSSNQLGSILTMHDNTVRLASKSQTYSSGSGKLLNQQYSGFWAGSNYALINAVDSEGKTTGWSIGPSNSNGYRAYLYDSSTSIQPNYGVGIGTQRFDVYAGGAGLYLGPGKAELRDKSYTTIHSDTETFIEGGNQQMYMHNGEVNIGNPNDTGNATGVHFQVFGWASFNGYVEGMGWTTKSTLSSKTRIEKLDTKDALNKIMSTDLETYQYKTEVAGGMTKRHAGPIIDDVHDVAQYSTPDEFINERRTGRSDADVIGYLMGAVQELKKQLDKVKEKINYE